MGAPPTEPAKWDPEHSRNWPASGGGPVPGVPAAACRRTHPGGCSRGRRWSWSGEVHQQVETSGSALNSRRSAHMSRKQRGSRNRDKARVKVARAHARVADARRDFHHQLSTALIRDNQAVAVEDLAVNGLGRTRLAKSIHDAGWSAFVAMLEYKAARYGRTFAKAGRFEPTSQVCSACGAKDGPKPLNVRTWTCAACRTVHDRDVNAARNVLALGRRESLNACGGSVRPGETRAAAGEPGSHRGAA